MHTNHSQGEKSSILSQILNTRLLITKVSGLFKVVSQKKYLVSENIKVTTVQRT